ncbi:CDP-glycerol glycerophosphotransferase family protein [Pontimicrobium sp. SW4]|uniref:CDP-glycerol glycerophosphotransferase family protein n=1 Tax=Pontimicrobium sp. SW4 TaxID=3153519 RepID=A0AAU7BV07_9FLAO
MKFILFCQNNYSFGILEPIKKVLVDKGYDYIWYVADKILSDFPYKKDKHTNKIYDLEVYKSDVIFIPGNQVPHYLRGLKTQIFHGLAGEKKGHFRIRHYFDLYLTQGPYFTNTFNSLKTKYKNFDVIETGWPKLDIYGRDKTIYNNEKNNLIKKHTSKYVLLYAPTFSPKLTSAPFLIEQIKKLADNNSNYLIFLKFHPLMDKQWLKNYQELANTTPNVIFQTEKNIVKFLLMADILISDTSSVIYEFLLLDKPAITFNNISKEIHWENSSEYDELEKLVQINLIKDPYAKSRSYICQQFHPYNDGNSALRMVEATENYIKTNGVPSKRKLSFLRRFKIYSIFGKQNKY